MATKFALSVTPDTPLASAVLDAVHEIAEKGMRIVGGPSVERWETDKGEHMAVVFTVEPMVAYNGRGVGSETGATSAE